MLTMCNSDVELRAEPPLVQGGAKDIPEINGRFHGWILKGYVHITAIKMTDFSNQAWKR